MPANKQEATPESIAQDCVRDALLNAQVRRMAALWAQIERDRELIRNRQWVPFAMEKVGNK